MNKILNFGSLNIDNVYSMPHIVRPGETLASFKTESYPGGKGLNQSIAVARAGGRIFHAGKIGSDGDILLQALKTSNVDCSYLVQSSQKNGHAVIQVEKSGQNSIILFGGTNRDIDTSMIDAVLDNFNSDNLLICQNEISNMEYLINSAYSKGIPIVLNPSPIDDEILKTDLNKLDMIIINEIEGKDFTQKESPDEILDALLTIAPNLKIVLTIGKDGAIYCDKARRLSHGIFDVKVVDTTAAGDTFLGFFVSAFYDGKPPEYALKLASAASSIAVSRAGAASSIPTLAEVNEFLGQ